MSFTSDMRSAPKSCSRCPGGRPSPTLIAAINSSATRAHLPLEALDEGTEARQVRLVEPLVRSLESQVPRLDIGSPRWARSTRRSARDGRHGHRCARRRPAPNPGTTASEPCRCGPSSSRAARRTPPVRRSTAEELRIDPVIDEAEETDLVADHTEPFGERCSIGVDRIPVEHRHDGNLSEPHVPKVPGTPGCRVTRTCQIQPSRVMLGP